MHKVLNRIGKSSASPAPAGRRTLLAALALGTCACSQTYHSVIPAPSLAVPDDRAAAFESGSQVLERLAEQPGPVRLTKHVAADWAIDRSGLINLDHPRAAQLDEGPEPIQIYVYVLEHPERGTFLIDSGVARSVARHGEDMPLAWPISALMPHETLHVRLDTATLLQRSSQPIAGVFLTHLHLDHVLGLQDVPKEVPLYVGPGEADDSRLQHLANRPTTNRSLQGFGPLREWSVEPPGESGLAVIDVFGDQSVFGLHIPGHTDGMMAFLVRTEQGGQLIAGDGCHTEFGWTHDVEPGSFNTDGEQAARSLAHLRAFAARHPEVKVHLGHQELHEASEGAARVGARASGALGAL